MKKQIKYTVILTALVILTSLLAAGCTNLLAEIQSAARAGFLADVQYRDMVDVDGGSYDQREYDSAYADSNGFQHTLSAYQIGAYEVTYELWYTVRTWAEGHGYSFGNEGREGSSGSFGGEPGADRYHPVTGVSWSDVVVWLNAYSEMMGYRPVYYSNEGMSEPIRASEVYNPPADYSSGSQYNPVVDWDADGYRLPSEGEWQYAATDLGENLANRAAGDDMIVETSTNLNDYAWWWKAGTQAVGELLPNALGLYDMSGNVNEWCYDTEDGWPAAIPETDFRNNFSYAERVVRGGGWNTNDGVQYELQTGYRYPDGATEPYSITDSRGFRVARYPGE